MLALIAGLSALLFFMPEDGFTLKRTAVGEPLKDFTLHTVEGQPLQLSKTLGRKATLVVFWATWSPRSAEALTDFQQLYDAHGPTDLRIVAVNVEHHDWKSGEEEKVAAYVAEQQATFPVVMDKDLEVFDAYGVIAVPSTILADARGQIVGVLESYSYMTRFDFREQILDALGVLPKQVEEPEPEVGYQPVGKAARYYRMGMLLLKKKMERKAIRAFEKAVAEDPDYAEAHLRLAELYEAAGSAAEAAQARTRAAALGAAPPDQGREAAEEPVREGAAGGEARIVAARYVRMGKLLLTKQRATAAVEVFRKAVEKDPQYLEAHLGLAEALEADGRAAEAEKARARAASISQ